MGKSNAAANVIDLEAFRQRKMRGPHQEQPPAAEARPATMLVPVWFCWVPMWTPFLT